jgi:hypothetical protein
MKPESVASRQMIRFSLDAEHSAATTKTVLANLEKAVVALRTSMRNGIILARSRSGWAVTDRTHAKH